MTPTLPHVREFVYTWLACYHRPPTLDDVVAWAGVPRGRAYACLWRLGLLP